MTNPQYEAPEFLEIASASGATYVPFQEAIANPRLAAQVGASALHQADQWTRRYAAFFDRVGAREGLEIVAVIERVKQKLGGRWPDASAVDEDQQNLPMTDEDS